MGKRAKQASISLNADLCSISIENFGFATMPEDLQEHFKSCGQIDRITVRVDDSGRSRGCAYMQFNSESGVAKSLLLDKSTFRGRQLRVASKLVAKKSKVYDGHCATHMQRMWTERRFTDALVKTATGSIPVHRAVLSAFPPFAAAFSGPFQENYDRVLHIDDVQHASVEAFLEFLYTGDLRGSANHSEVLKLAHRNEQSELVEYCAWALVEFACPENICEVVRSLRVFKLEKEVVVAWNHLHTRISVCSALRESLMMSA